MALMHSPSAVASGSAGPSGDESSLAGRVGSGNVRSARAVGAPRLATRTSHEANEHVCICKDVLYYVGVHGCQSRGACIHIEWSVQS
jgi:hypothetical protein